MASSWGLVGNGALWQAIVDMAYLALSSKQCRYVRFLYGAGLAIGKYGEGGCTVRVLSGADVVPAIRAADGMDDTDSGGHGSILNERAKKVFPILGSIGKRLLYGGDDRLLPIRLMRDFHECAARDGHKKPPAGGAGRLIRQPRRPDDNRLHSDKNAAMSGSGMWLYVPSFPLSRRVHER